ncbi:unnamed protein product, partial [Laminaria digitata]
HHIYQAPGISLLLATASLQPRYNTQQQQQQATTAVAGAVHRACYNLLATTLHPCRAQQQQATACTCGACALYSVELFRKEPEIRHPAHISLC